MVRKLLLTIILSAFALLSVTTQTKDEFISEVKDAYSKYQITFDYNTPNYEISVVRGICNSKCVYGLYFYSVDANRYEVRLFGEKEYTVNKTKRGDVSLIAISNIKEDITVEVYLGENKQYFGNLVLSSFNESDLVDYNVGNGKGAPISKLRSGDLSFLGYYLIACCVVILFSMVVVFIFYKKKKGMFDKSIRSEGVFNFKEFLNTDIEEEERNEIDIDNVIDLEEEAPNTEVVEEKSVYKKVKDEDFYGDGESGFPLKEYLADKGFVTDYSMIGEEEKDQIMLELIKLKNEKKITNDEYLDEVYKLWKK